MKQIDMFESFNITGKGDVFCCPIFEGWGKITEMEVICTTGNPKVKTGRYKVIEANEMHGFCLDGNIAFLLEPFVSVNEIYDLLTIAESAEQKVRIQIEEFTEKCENQVKDIYQARDEIIMSCLKLADDIGIPNDYSSFNFQAGFDDLSYYEVCDNNIILYFETTYSDGGKIPGYSLIVYYKAFNCTIESLRELFKVWDIPGYIELEVEK